MAKKKGWSYTDTIDGFVTITLDSWENYTDFINAELKEYKTFIFRGQCNSEWPLESSFERLFKKTSGSDAVNSLASLLKSFLLATRGRRGRNPVKIKKENDWWAIGQHNGLATPLLDWTNSPFVALYFAFDEEIDPDIKYRSVYAISKHAINKIKKVSDVGTPFSELKIHQPITDENPRLVSQNALFVRVPNGFTLDEVIIEHFKGDNKYWNLCKIIIPNSDRESCLIFLNRMNINHLSLFPDLYGASLYSNRELMIENY